ncbi:MAG: hypothetical protein ABI425_03430 [Patescibacteria group bacterium]
MARFVRIGQSFPGLTFDEALKKLKDLGFEYRGISPLKRDGKKPGLNLKVPDQVKIEISPIKGKTLKKRTRAFIKGEKAIVLEELVWQGKTIALHIVSFPD